VAGDQILFADLSRGRRGRSGPPRCATIRGVDRHRLAYHPVAPAVRFLRGGRRAGVRPST